MMKNTSQQQQRMTANNRSDGMSDGSGGGSDHQRINSHESCESWSSRRNSLEKDVPGGGGFYMAR